MPTVPRERASKAGSAGQAAATPESQSSSQHAGQSPGPSLGQRYASVKARIEAAAKRGGQSPENILLVAVTKYASIDQVRQLIELGHVDLGESQVQNLVHRAAQIDEFLQRHRLLAGEKLVGKKPAPRLPAEKESGREAPRTVKQSAVPAQVRWHMIGHLQRNKVRKALGIARLIHSVDSLRLAEEIQAASSKLDEPIEVLIQVNVSGEKSKFGVAPAAARHLIDQMDTMLNIRVRGLMCMAPISDTPDDVRPVFQRGRELFEDVRRSGVAGDRFDILSMGMSSDFEVAIEAGANLVRVGSAIFGEPAEPEGADAPE